MAKADAKVDPAALAERLVNYRGWLIEQQQAALRNYEAADATKKEKTHAWHGQLLLQGLIAEFDRRVGLRDLIAALRQHPQEDRPTGTTKRDWDVLLSTFAIRDGRQATTDNESEK